MYRIAQTSYEILNVLIQSFNSTHTKEINHMLYRNIMLIHASGAGQIKVLLLALLISSTVVFWNIEVI